MIALHLCTSPHGGERIAAAGRAGERELTTTGVGSIAAVVLAAGGSTRMGHPKQLIRHDGKALVSRAAEAAAEAGADPVVVILGAQADEIRPIVSRIAGITIVMNPDWETGLASSLTTGLRAVHEARRDGVLVTLADQPLVDASVLRRLVAAFIGGARIVASGYSGTVAVPALFGTEHVPALLGLTGDAGAGAWLQNRLPEVTVVPLDTAMLDLDTPADLARLAGRQNSR